MTASFRHFTLTGELATKLTDDPVVLKHALALLETGDEQEIGLFVSDPEQLVRTSNGTEYFVTATVEETEEKLPGLDPDSGNDEDGDGLIEPLPCDEYPEACDFRRELQRLYSESRLWKAKYKKDWDVLWARV